MRDLLSGLAMGFTDAQKSARENQWNNEIKKAQIKVFKMQLDQEETKQNAIKQITSVLGANRTQDVMVPQEGAMGESYPAQQQTQTLPPQTMQQFFSTPQGAGLGIQAGMGIKDLNTIQRGEPGQALMEAIMKQYFPGSGGQPQGTPQASQIGGGQPQGAPQGMGGPQGAPQGGGFGGFVPNISVDSTGKVGVDLKPSKVIWKDTGNDFVPIDETTGQPRQGVDSIPKNETYVQTVMEGDQPKVKVFSKRTNQEVATLGTPEQKVPLSDSTRIALAEQGSSNINQIVKTIMPDGKNIDKSIIFQMDAPFGGVGVGREMNQLASTAIAAQILLQSGVTARPDELVELRGTYLPTTLDLTNEGLAKRKMERFSKLLEGSIDLATLPVSLRKRIEERRKQESGRKGNSSKTEDPLGIR
jgi:hypothetical protein